MAKKGLTPKQERFVAEYLINADATAAAIKAGYSAKTAAQQGYQLLHNTSVIAKLSAKQQKLAEKSETTAERVIDELVMLAFYDPADLATVLNEDGDEVAIRGPQDIKRLPLRIRKAIVGWGWDRSGNFTLKFAPKTATLELLGKHLGLFDSAGDEALKEGLAALLQSGRKRARETQAESLH